MHFNIYLDDDTGEKLNRAAERMGESRNALIRRAVGEWLKRHGKPEWPEVVLTFEGLTDMPPFEEARRELKSPLGDPFA